MKGLSSSVWDREGDTHTLSQRTFVVMLTLWTVLGLGASAVAAWYSQSWHIGWPGAIAVLVVAIAGVFIALGSDQPPISLLGYAMVAIPFGLLLGPVVALYTAVSVAKVLGLTTGLVVILGTIGAIWPTSLEHWGIWLLGALVLLILGTVGLSIAAACGVPVGPAMTWLDWLGVALFSGYVVFDLNRAMRVERTHDNAIDCALAVYLDFVNLFIRLLSLFGQRRD